MDKVKLLSALKSRDVHESLYCLDGLHEQSESYSIVEVGDLFSVYYKERGEATELAKNLTEEEACDFVYSEFKSVFNWL
jgi:hypothetical protein